MGGHVVRRLGQSALAGAVVVGLIAIPVTPVAAADAADQSYAATGPVVFIHDVTTAAQTFTAGRTGGLNRVDLSVGRLEDAGALTVQIETTSGGVPSGTVLAAATVTLASVPNDSVTHPVTVQLPSSLATAGVQYAIVLSAPSAAVDSAWIWNTDSPGSYIGGTAVDGDTLAGTWKTLSSDDRAFATWVESTPCAAGSYSSTGFGQCVAADPGNFATGPGATSQTPCALGTYQPAAASVSCLPAPIGSYVDSTGAIATTPCPAGTTTAGTGATRASDCQGTAPLPTITCAATPAVLWPPNNRLVAVSVVVTTTNASAFQLVSVTANGGGAGDIVDWTVGTADVSGSLRATRNGNGGGRIYALLYEASGSGGTARCTVTIAVPHSPPGDRSDHGDGNGGDQSDGNGNGHSDGNGNGHGSDGGDRSWHDHGGHGG